MKKNHFVGFMILAASALMLSSCANDKSSQIITGSESKATESETTTTKQNIEITESSDSYSKYEWGSLDLPDQDKKNLLKYEEAEPFTYIKDNKIYAKCKNGDYVEGYAGALQIFSKVNDYSYYDCGSSFYSYHDYRDDMTAFYDEFGSAFGTNWDLSAFGETDSVDSYTEAISVIDVKIYSIYHVDGKKFSDGLLCSCYYAYGENYNTEYIISGFNNDANEVKTYCTVLDVIKSKLTKYKVLRGISGHLLYDNQQNITFNGVTQEESKQIHDGLITLKNGDETDYYTEVTYDTYADGCTDFQTKITYGTKIYEDIEVKNHISIKYVGGNLEYQLSYPLFMYKDTSVSYGYNYLGYVRREYYTSGDYVYTVLKKNVNSTYLMVNSTDAEMKFETPEFIEYSPFKDLILENASKDSVYTFYTYLDKEIPFDIENDKAFFMIFCLLPYYDFTVDVTIELYDSDFRKIEVKRKVYDEDVFEYYADEALGAGVYYISIKVNEDVAAGEQLGWCMSYIPGE